MSFKFDFFPDEEVDKDTESPNDVSDTCDMCESEQIFVEECHFEKYKDLNVNQFTFLPYRPFYKSKTKSDNTEEDAKSKDGISDDVSDEDEDEHGLVRYLVEEDAGDETSDLVPNVYEGGHKVWECSLDLCEYLSEEEISLEGLKVIELGCGCGLPGVFAHVAGAESVHFQDYNKDVLEKRTIPNVVMNAPENTDSSRVNQRCQFWSGDWSKFTQQTAERKCSYDVILTSETIYSTMNYPKLHHCMQSLLDTRGVIYLSAKSYYFGVGGGTRQFIEFVEGKDVFTIETVKTIDTCLKREILKMTFKSR